MSSIYYPRKRLSAVGCRTSSKAYNVRNCIFYTYSNRLNSMTVSL